MWCVIYKCDHRETWRDKDTLGVSLIIDRVGGVFQSALHSVATTDRAVTITQSSIPTVRKRK